jgi:hypothetical protein
MADNYTGGGFGDIPSNDPGERGDKALSGIGSGWNPGVGTVPASRHGSANLEGFDSKYGAVVANDGTQNEQGPVQAKGGKLADLGC